MSSNNIHRFQPHKSGPLDDDDDNDVTSPPQNNQWDARKFFHGEIWSFLKIFREILAFYKGGNFVISARKKVFFFNKKLGREIISIYKLAPVKIIPLI